MAFFGDNACHAWGTGNVSGTLYSSYNMSSLTDNGTGDATFNFTTNTGTTNYCGVQGIKWTGNPEMVMAIHTLSSSSIRVRNGYTYYGGMAWYDTSHNNYFHVAVFTSY